MQDHAELIKKRENPVELSNILFTKFISRLTNSSASWRINFFRYALKMVSRNFTLFMIFYTFKSHTDSFQDNNNGSRQYGLFPSKSSAVLAIGTLVTVIPTALFFWLGNSVFAYVNSDNTDSKEGLLHQFHWNCFGSYFFTNWKYLQKQFHLVNGSLQFRYQYYLVFMGIVVEVLISVEQYSVSKQKYTF